MTQPELGFGSIRAQGSGLSLDLVSCVKIPKKHVRKFTWKWWLAVQKIYIAFQTGLGGKGSHMAFKDVKTGSWGPTTNQPTNQQKLRWYSVLCPFKAQLYLTKSYSLVFHFCRCIFLGITSGVLTLLSSWKIHYTCAKSTCGRQIDGWDCQTLSWSDLLLPDGCLVATLWIFTFDPERFYVNLDFENYIQIISF